MFTSSARCNSSAACSYSSASLFRWGLPSSPRSSSIYWSSTHSWRPKVFRLPSSSRSSNSSSSGVTAMRSPDFCARNRREKSRPSAQRRAQLLILVHFRSNFDCNHINAVRKTRDGSLTEWLDWGLGTHGTRENHFSSELLLPRFHYRRSLRALLLRGNGGVLGYMGTLGPPSL